MILRQILKPPLLILMLAMSLHGGDGGYLSMGFRIGYEFGTGYTFTLKTSYGLFQYDSNVEMAEESIPFKTFESLSLGYRMRFGRKNSNYLFTDLQAGNIVGGTGVGLALYKERFGSWHTAPRLSVFGGLFLWGTYDYVFDPKINSDIGINMMFPDEIWSKD